MTRKILMFNTDVVFFNTLHPVVLEIEPRALGDVSKCSTIELYIPSPYMTHSWLYLRI